MPLLNLNITQETKIEQAEIIASRLTQLTQKHLHKDPRLTAVNINHTKPDHWFINKQKLTDTNNNSFSLHIYITEGTNTPDQIATYIEAVYQTMAEILNSVRAESYIIVDQKDAAHWGYGGQTQKMRSTLKT